MKKIIFILVICPLLLCLAACHEHIYTKVLTLEPGCDKEGEYTYTCSCGDCYTENISATEHLWGEWTRTASPTYYLDGSESRVCSVCSEKESRSIQALSLSTELKSLPKMISDIGFFTDPSELNAERIFAWAINHLEPVSEQKDFDNYVFTYTYSVSSINSLSEKYFGFTRDFNGITNSEPYDSTEYIYNSEDNTVSVVYNGAFGDVSPEIEYKNHLEVYEHQFNVTYSKTYYEEEPFDIVICVKIEENKIFVLSQTRA